MSRKFKFTSLTCAEIRRSEGQRKVKILLEGRTNSNPTAAKYISNGRGDGTSRLTHLSAGADSANRGSLHHGDHDERGHGGKSSEEHCLLTEGSRWP